MSEISLPAEPKILIFQTAFLGDVVLSTPLASGLKKLFPKSHMAFLATPPFDKLLQDHPAIDEVILYDKRTGGRGMKGSLGLARQLKKMEFDLTISPHRSFRSAMIQFLARIPERIGFSESAGAFLYKTRVTRNQKLHEVDRNLLLLTPLGYWAEKKEYPKIVYSPEDEASAEKLLAEAGAKTTDNLVGLLPGSEWATKRWPPARFGELARILNDRFGIIPVLIGGRKDAAIGTEILSIAPENTINLIGWTNLGEAAAVIDRCLLAIGNDTGPMHIAAALGKPTVSIFGPTVPSQGFAPYSEKAAVVEADISCRPCSPHGPKVCPQQHFECMLKINPEEVVAAAAKLL